MKLEQNTNEQQAPQQTEIARRVHQDMKALQDWAEANRNSYEGVESATRAISFLLETLPVTLRLDLLSTLMATVVINVKDPGDFDGEKISLQLATDAVSKGRAAVSEKARREAMAAQLRDIFTQQEEPSTDAPVLQ
jgi:hypothetical protein